MEPYIKQEDEGKYRCKTCQKLFKAPSFIEKHVANKHSELVKHLEEVRVLLDRIFQKSFTKTRSCRFLILTTLRLTLITSSHLLIRLPRWAIVKRHLLRLTVYKGLLILLITDALPPIQLHMEVILRRTLMATIGTRMGILTLPRVHILLRPHHVGTRS